MQRKSSGETKESNESGKATPFIHFRKEPANEDIASDTETESTIVAKWWDVHDWSAKLLLSDGRILFPDTYVESSRCMAKAIWVDPIAELELEVASNLVKDGVLMKPSVVLPPSEVPGVWQRSRRRGVPEASKPKSSTR